METKKGSNVPATSIVNCDIKTLVLAFPKKQFIASGGTEEQFIKEAGFALQIIRNNPSFEKMDRLSIVDAVVNVALTGLSLNPVLKLGYLVPFKGKLYFMASYMGKIEILMRTGIVKNVWANLVYEKDEFIIHEGSKREIIHNPDVFGDRGEVIGGYWVAVLPNEEKMMGTMPRSRIDEIKSRSEAVKAGKGGPWDTDFEEMARKTIINNGFKFIPKTGISEDVIKALSVDQQIDDAQFMDWKDRQINRDDKDFTDDSPPDNEGIENATIIEESDHKKDHVSSDELPLK